MALVGVGIRPLGRAQQRQSQHVALCVVSIFRIVEQAQSMLAIRDVSPSLRWNLKLRLLCGIVTSSWTFHRSKWNLVGRLIAMCAYRERNLQQDVFLMPFRLHPYVDTRSTRVKRDVANKS